jgi:Ni/Co efflux regulator RcnB
VNDWHGHRLHRPPRGHHWVRNGNGGDYLLVALTTGIIMNMMFGHNY